MTVDSKKEGNRELMRYAGLAMQFLVAIGATVFAGLKLDGWLRLSFPLLIWLLPLLVIVGMTYHIFKETSGKK